MTPTVDVQSPEKTDMAETKRDPAQIWKELYEHLQRAQKELAEQGVELTCEYKLRGMRDEEWAG